MSLLMFVDLKYSSLVLGLSHCTSSHIASIASMSVLRRVAALVLSNVSYWFFQFVYVDGLTPITEVHDAVAPVLPPLLAVGAPPSSVMKARSDRGWPTF